LKKSFITSCFKCCYQFKKGRQSGLKTGGVMGPDLKL